VDDEKALQMVEGGGVIVMDENLQDAGGVLLGTDATRSIREQDGGERAIIVEHSANQTEAENDCGCGERRRGARKRTRRSCRGACFEQLVEFEV